MNRAHAQTEMDRLLEATAVGHTAEWSVIPLRPGDKRPAFPKWADLATNDSVSIRERWNGHDYNIGGLLGNRFVIEHERDCHPEVAARFWEDFGGKPETRCHRSPNGSEHVILELPGTLPTSWPL